MVPFTFRKSEVWLNAQSVQGLEEKWWIFMLLTRELMWIRVNLPFFGSKDGNRGKKSNALTRSPFLCNLV